VRLAGFASAIGSLVPRAAATLARDHPGLEIGSIDTHPPEALELLRTGKVEVAIIFRYDETEQEPSGIRMRHLLDDPMYLLSHRRTRGLASLSEATWIAGCERCRGHLLALCQDSGFEPRIGYESDDMVLIQALVAAGVCVATLPGLALRAHHADGVVAKKLPRLPRRVYAATYGNPPDPPGGHRAPRRPRRRRRGGIADDPARASPGSRAARALGRESSRPSFARGERDL
jgi:DNA-binding transcriptional LysR family regulator